MLSRLHQRVYDILKRTSADDILFHLQLNHPRFRKTTQPTTFKKKNILNVFLCKKNK